MDVPASLKTLRKIFSRHSIVQQRLILYQKELLTLNSRILIQIHRPKPKQSHQNRTPRKAKNHRLASMLVSRSPFINYLLLRWRQFLFRYGFWQFWTWACFSKRKTLVKESHRLLLWHWHLSHSFLQFDNKSHRVLQSYLYKSLFTWLPPRVYSHWVRVSRCIR